MSSLNVACDISGMQGNHASEKYVTSRLNEHRQYDMRMSSADWPTGCFSLLYGLHCTCFV